MSLPRIWLITDPEAPAGPLHAIRAALDGPGRDRVAVVLRAKEASGRTFLEWAEALRRWTTSSRSALYIHGRPDVAQVVAAEGVHLAESGLPIATVRARWPMLTVGVSRHDREGLRTAANLGADYAFLSPVHAVAGKNPPLGIGGFARIVVDTTTPVVALGGVEPEHVAPLLEVGAQGVAVQRALYRAKDPRQALDRLLHALDNHPPTDR
ncbi:MAG: thiamine phosphate synthase [Polyangiales bacterium]